MEKEKFSIIKRAKSFTHAGRGMYVFVKTTHNSWLHIVIFLGVIFAGIFFNINYIDWIFLIIAAGFVFTAEAFNTAIEIDMDLTSPEFHPYARDTKDVAAGAVLISALTAILVGILVFSKYIIAAL